jgi:hypothetical protein
VRHRKRQRRRGDGHLAVRPRDFRLTPRKIDGYCLPIC